MKPEKRPRLIIFQSSLYGYCPRSPAVSAANSKNQKRLGSYLKSWAGFNSQKNPRQLTLR
jgi:hypothetical protein